MTLILRDIFVLVDTFGDLINLVPPRPEDDEDDE
jgi:hypothetical protein